MRSSVDCYPRGGRKEFFFSNLLLAWIVSAPLLGAASVTGVSPVLGHPGDIVRINGSGFDANAANDIVHFGPNRAAVLAATASQLTVQVPNAQPLGPTLVSVNGANGPKFLTVANAKIASIPPNPVAACEGCTCVTCGCQDPNGSPCVSQGGILGGNMNGSGGSIYGERGEFFQTMTDMTIPGRPGAARTVQFTIQRQYRSAANNNGALGQLWDHNYFEGLTTEPDGSIVHHNGVGRYDRYLVNNQGMFVAPAEFYTSLVRNLNGSYTLTYRDRTVKQFDAAGKIQRITDRNGNSLQFAYNGQNQLATVTDTLGRPIAYTYDGSGHLHQITDFAGRTVTYTYDGSGNLSSVTSPAVTGTPNGNDFPSGKTTRYTYDSHHRVLTITRPNETASAGPPVIQNIYDGNGRVISQTYGGTNSSGISAGGAYTYSYTPLNSGTTSDDPNVPVMRTQQTDPNGNVTQYDYNRLGYPVVIREFTHGVRAADPPVYVTTESYNADGRLVEKNMPQGNTIKYVYDEGNPDRFQRGNMLQQTEIPDVMRGGDQSSITTAYTYETSFNHIATMTEPRGNDPSYVPQNGGSQSAARYTTTYTYDANGNLLHKQQPTVKLPNGMSQSIVTDYTYNQFGQITSMTDPEGNVTQYMYYVMNDPGNTTGGYLKQTTIDATTSVRRVEPSPPAQIVNQYSYDAVGNLTRIIDGRGNDTLYTYNQLNQVVESQSEAPFRYITYTYYDANGNIVRRDIENRVVAESGGKPTFSADGNFTVQSGTPNFFINRYTYDILDKTVKQDLDATGSTPSRLITEYRYDGDQNRIQETLPAGNVHRYQYDERNLVFTDTRGFGDPAASTTRYDYDSNRNLADTVDGRGFTTRSQYDGFDRRTGVTDAVGGQTTSHYDPAGNVISASSFGQPKGPSPANDSGSGNVLLNQHTSEYDELSRRFQYDEEPVNAGGFVASGVVTQRPPSVTAGPGTLNPGNISTQYIYDRDSRLVQKVEDDFATTTSQYDGVGRVVMTTDPQANTVQYTYDGDNNVTQTIETDISQKSGVANETFTTTYRYDSHNRQTSVSDNCGNTRRMAYDSRDNVTEVTDAKADNTVGCSGVMNGQGNSMRFTYDGFSRRVQEVRDLRTGGVGSNSIDMTNAFNPNGRIATTTTYDANSRVTSVSDNNGNTTRYSYDALDRKTVETLPDNTTTTYTYDGDDNLITLTDNNGTVQSHTYDRIDRRIQTSVTPAAAVIGSTLETYQYDGLSRMTRTTDNNDPADPASASTVNFAYDSLGRVVEETQNGHAVDSAWSAQARRVSLTYGNARQLNYTYDSLERIKTIRDASAVTNLAQYTYTGPQRILQRQYQNGTQLTYLDNAGTTDVGYDALRRTIQRRDLGTGNSLIVGFGHAYDREDNKSYEAKLHSAVNSELYTYDSVYRIVDFARGQLNGSNTGIVGAPSSTQDWTLDGLGNWRGNLINGMTQTRTVNSTNEYAQIAGPGASIDMQSDDANGNLTLSTGQARAYQWDYKNRLRKACSLTGSAVRCTDAGATVVAVYSYDALNRRIRKVVTNSGPLNGTTNYYYDAWQTIEERNAADTVTQQYVYGIDLDEPLVLDLAGGQRYFYHQNTLQSTFALTDTSGAVVEGYQYDSYGRQTVLGPNFSTVLGVTSTVGNPYMFTGQRFDPETGLYYYRNRYYSPTLGRFLSRDRIKSVDVNLYEYVTGRPTAQVDPYGDAPKDCAKNTIPKTVKVQAGDVSWRDLPFALKSRTQGTFKDASDLVNAQLRSDCDCIKSLVLVSHSNNVWFEIRGRRYTRGKDSRPETWKELEEASVVKGDDPTKFTRLVAENAANFYDVLRETACFCKPCTIWLLGCNVGLGEIPGKLAEASGCTVQAPKGEVYASLESPHLSRMTTSEFQGSEAKFATFPPPQKK